jgi:hypothetical protein
MTISWVLYVIDPHGDLHLLLPDGEFTFQSVKSALASLSNISFAKTVDTHGQDGLVAAIDLVSFGSHQTVHIFLSSGFAWSPDVERSVNRAVLAESGQIGFTFVVVADDFEPTDLARTVADCPNLQVVQIANRDDSYFQFFRSLAESLLFPAVPEVLAVNSLSIACMKSQVVVEPFEIQTTTVCRCHGVRVTQKVSLNCGVSGRHVSQTHQEYSLGQTAVPFRDGGLEQPRLVAQGRIAFEAVSVTILVGASWLLESQQAEFHRMLNEMRCQKQGIIAKKTPSLVIGGEFWLLVADALTPVLHCKRIANRTQILRVEGQARICLPADVSTVPILPDISQLDSISPFTLGHDELLSSFQ